MDDPSIWLIVAIVILIVMSAFFSASETAYTTVNKVRLKTLADDGNKKAVKALKMAENYDRLLSTILVGNNIVNIVIASLSTVLFGRLIQGESLAVTVSTIASTVVLLIFSEITPKSIAKENPEKFCMNSYGVFIVFYVILTPINELFMLWKKLLKKIFRLSSDNSVTEDELKTYVEVAESGGEISEHESELIRSAIEFDDLDIYDIMTPRVNVVAVEENDSLDEIAKKFVETGYSRLPVYSKTIDSVVGIIHEKDFYVLQNKKGDKKLSDIMQSSVCVSKTMKISAVLRIMQKAKMHMAIVVDEFGGTSGIVTMEDIIEELIGEVYDEHDEIEVLLKRVDDDSFLVSGAENLEAMFEVLGVNVKEEFESITVGGWVIEEMGKIPVAGEKTTFQNLEITVTKATVKKVVEVRIKVLPPEEE